MKTFVEWHRRDPIYVYIKIPNVKGIISDIFTLNNNVNNYTFIISMYLL